MGTAVQFDALAGHSLSTATNPTLCVKNSRFCPIDASPDLDLKIINSVTKDRPEHSSNPHNEECELNSGQLLVSSVAVESIQLKSEPWLHQLNPTNVILSVAQPNP